MANYQVLDAYGSVITVNSSVVATGVQRPIVDIGNTVTVISSGGSVSGTVGASVIGQLPAGTAVLGSVAALQAGPPWVVSSVYGNISGSVVSFQGTTPWLIGSVYGNISGSVAAFIQGNASVIAIIQAPSIVGTYSEDATHTSADRGLFVLGVRNDAVASFMGANLEYGPMGTDSAGRALTKPFAAEEARVEGYNSVVSGSVTTLVGAAGTGLRNYITDIVLVNTGAATTLVTFRSGGGTSVLGYGIAPTGGGSNMTGLATPFRTLPNETFDIQATTSTSVLFATVKGYKAP